MIFWNGRLAASLLFGSMLALAANVPAAVGAVQFEFAPFGNCLDVSGLPASTETIGHLRSRTGELKAANYSKSDNLGRNHLCFPTAVLPGDRVRVTSTGLTRGLIVPQFSLAVSRVTDVVSGSAPKFTPVKIVTLNPYTSTQLTRNILADANGRYTTDFTADYNIRGGDRVTASWRNAQGDLVTDTVRAPLMTVWYSSPATSLFLNPFASAALELKDSTGVSIASANGTANAQGALEQRIWRSTARRIVVTAAGQRVIGNFATDASVTIPTLNLQANSTSDIVTGQCMNNVSYLIEIRGGSPSRFISRVGTTASDGTFTRDFTAEPFDIKPLDTVTLYCRFGTGDEVARLALAGP